VNCQLPSRRQPSPILISHLFAPLLEGLLSLLSDLSEEEWEKPTVCEGWTVKDVALHLLGVEAGILSRKRDGFAPAVQPIDSLHGLVALVNELNATWVQATRRISPRLLCDLLQFTGRQACEYFQSLDPYQFGNPVSWTGPDPAPVWLDLAREYTERWHHQQHIRDVVGRPGLKEPRFFAPVLDAFVQALPHTFRDVNAPEGTVMTLTLSGESGGQWHLLRKAGSWNLYREVDREPDAEMVLDEDVAWRLFTRGLGKHEAQAQALVMGDQALALKVLDMVSIIA
jgi:uncharacterized protein (TIGR03083 family)